MNLKKKRIEKKKLNKKRKNIKEKIQNGDERKKKKWKKETKKYELMGELK